MEGVDVLSKSCKPADILEVEQGSHVSTGLQWITRFTRPFDDLPNLKNMR